MMKMCLKNDSMNLFSESILVSAAGPVRSRSWLLKLLSAVLENEMLSTILIIVLLLMLFGAIPRWNHSRNWGYAPSGGLGLILIILVILLLLGRI
jgi:hypothetical protein